MRRPRRNPSKHPGRFDWRTIKHFHKYMNSSEKERREELAESLWHMGVLADDLHQIVHKLDLTEEEEELLEDNDGLLYWEEMPESLVDKAFKEGDIIDLMASFPDESDRPTWAFFLGGVELYTDKKDGLWLVHCTNEDPYDVVRNFRGACDASKLGLTTHRRGMDDDWADDDFCRWGFAYPLSSFHRYGVNWGECRYGSNLILLKVSAYVEGYHDGDQEPQAIFWADNILSGVAFEGAHYPEIEVEETQTDEDGDEWDETALKEFKNVEELAKYLDDHPDVLAELDFFG